MTKTKTTDAAPEEDEGTMPLSAVQLMGELMAASHAETMSITDKLMIYQIERAEYLEHLIHEVLRTAPYLGTTGEYEACLDRLRYNINPSERMSKIFRERAELINRGERPDTDPPPMFAHIAPRYQDGWTSADGWGFD